MDITPTQLYPGYTTDGTSITIPMTDLTGLSAPEADAATGDGRKVLYGLIQGAYEALMTLDAANRPQKMSMNKTNPQAVGIDESRIGYTTTFDVQLDPSVIEVSPEA